MTHEFRHQKFFKELRKRNKGAQAISEQASTEVDERSTGPGLKQQADKLPSGGGRVGPKVSSSA